MQEIQLSITGNHRLDRTYPYTLASTPYVLSQATIMGAWIEKVSASVDDYAKDGSPWGLTFL